MKKLYLILLVFLFSIYHLSFSQSLPDFQWWAEAHNWDGVTHWSRYIIRSPGYMGPNALPVPQIKKANISDEINLETAFEYHKGLGEFAYNPYLNLNIPLAKEKVAIDLIYRPFEYYETEEFIRQQRYGRNKNCKGIAKGDLYIGTIIKILNKEKHFLDGNLEIYLKTTTGKDLANARHIDAPAYYFSLNLGKTLYSNNGFLKSISLYTISGMYVWQADFNNNRQNDAYLYGIHSDFNMKPFAISLSTAGYSGYMNLKDKPIVLRSEISKDFTNSLIYFSYQYGLRDFIQNSYRIGFQYRIPL